MSSNRLLIVEDSTEFARFLEGIATKLGYEVKAVGSLAQFDHAIETWPPSVLMLDIVMPERDGLELLGELERRKYEGRVILMSGADEFYLKMAASSARMRGLNLTAALRKPARREDVEELLASLIES